MCCFCGHTAMCWSTPSLSVCGKVYQPLAYSRGNPRGFFAHYITLSAKVHVHVHIKTILEHGVTQILCNLLILMCHAWTPGNQLFVARRVDSSNKDSNNPPRVILLHNCKLWPWSQFKLPRWPAISWSDVVILVTNGITL